MIISQSLYRKLSVRIIEVIKVSMNKAIKSDLVRGHKVNNIPTVEFELTLEQVEEINEVCKPFVVDKKEGD